MLGLWRQASLGLSEGSAAFQPVRLLALPPPPCLEPDYLSTTVGSCPADRRHCQAIRGREESACWGFTPPPYKRAPSLTECLSSCQGALFIQLLCSRL